MVQYILGFFSVIKFPSQDATFGRKKIGPYAMMADWTITLDLAKIRPKNIIGHNFFLKAHPEVGQKQK